MGTAKISKMTPIEKPTEDAIAFRVAECYLENAKMKPAKAQIAAREIAARVSKEFNLSQPIRRTDVYPYLKKAAELDLIRLTPPRSKALEQALGQRFDLNNNQLTVVDCPVPESQTGVAYQAADATAERIKEIFENRSDKTKCVTLGLSPGRAMLDFSIRLAQIMRHDTNFPQVRLVATASGCPATSPEFSAISFYNLYPKDIVKQKIGMFAGTIVPVKRFTNKEDGVTTRPGFTEAKNVINEIDVVVAALSDSNDPHSLFAGFYDNGKRKETRPPWWNDCIGDIMYRPFSSSGPILEASYENKKSKVECKRTVTLFELDFLVNMATKADKAVILIARQCAECGSNGTSKSQALRPILDKKNKDVLRAFSHLFIDSKSASELLMHSVPTN